MTGTTGECKKTELSQEAKLWQNTQEELEMYLVDLGIDHTTFKPFQRFFQPFTGFTVKDATNFRPGLRTHEAPQHFPLEVLTARKSHAEKIYERAKKVESSLRASPTRSKSDDDALYRAQSECKHRVWLAKGNASALGSQLGELIDRASDKSSRGESCPRCWYEKSKYKVQRDLWSLADIFDGADQAMTGHTCKPKVSANDKDTLGASTLWGSWVPTILGYALGPQSSSVSTSNGS